MYTFHISSVVLGSGTCRYKIGNGCLGIRYFDLKVELIRNDIKLQSYYDVTTFRPDSVLDLYIYCFNSHIMLKLCLYNIYTSV